MSPRMHTAFAVAGSLVVASAVAWGFVLVGSPQARRAARFDEQRLRDLQTIADEIEWMVVDREDSTKLREALPKTLTEAAARARNDQIRPRDPETGEPYGYTVKDDHTYELCATFSGAREWDTEVFWNHPAGAHCFTIDVLNPPTH